MPGQVGGMRGGMGMMTPVVTATDRCVFVLRGGTLYQFDVNGLRLLAQTQLPAGQGGAAIGGGFGRGGGRGGAGRRSGIGDGAGTGTPSTNP